MAGSVGGGMTLFLLSVHAGSGLEKKSLQDIMHKHNYFWGFNIMFDVMEGTN